MKPLITTAKVLAELATGISPESLAITPGLFVWDTEDEEFILARGDRVEDQRLVVIRDDFGDKSFIPESLRRYARPVLNRMAQFAERARQPGALSLPRGWNQYKHDSFVAFYAVPGLDPDSTRWICEVVPAGRSDVIFWQTTSSGSKSPLAEFQAAGHEFEMPEREWATAVQLANDFFDAAERVEVSDVEIVLPSKQYSATRGRAFDEWDRVISEDQRKFVYGPVDKSIRLRGAAGTGKTLSLAMKAVHQARVARESGVDARILVVTHSWSLAAEISDSIDSFGFGPFPEIETYPLLALASAITPGVNLAESEYRLIGDDSFSGKTAQLGEILDLLVDFMASDWITYKRSVSMSLKERFESDSGDDHLALAWDLLLEFGSVIGAASIFPGAGAESRYASVQRAGWMLPLEGRGDLKVVFALYTQYMASLDERGLWTSDQVLADLLNDLQKHAWNRLRRDEGYDLIFVDEFHLFNPLERQVLHYLSRDVTNYPRIFMAFDPRQSPSEAFIGLAADESRAAGSIPDGTEVLGEVENVELTRIHRYTPEILSLVKHVHHEFPTLDLGGDWKLNIGAAESTSDSGAKPTYTVSATRAAEETDIAKSINGLYQEGPIALAVVDSRQWPRFNQFASLLNESPRLHVATIAGRTDLEGLGYRKKGLIVAPAEYLAGLQFESVIVAGIPDMEYGAQSPSERTRFLSLLYLAISRAQTTVQIFSNDDDGGPAEVLQRAVDKGLLGRESGSLV